MEAALDARRFRINWVDSWTAVAERGNRVAFMFFGAMAQYMRIGVVLGSGAPGATVVRIDCESSGWVGGVIGASRAKANFTGLCDELCATFLAAGVLLDRA